MTNISNTNDVSLPSPNDYAEFEAEHERSMARYLKHVDFFINDTCTQMKAVQTLLKKAQLYVKDVKFKDSSTQVECRTIFDSLKNRIKMMQADVTYAENEIRNLRVYSAAEYRKQMKNSFPNSPKKGYIVD